MNQLLLAGESEIADGAYRNTTSKNRGSILFNKICFQVRARNKTVKKRLKQFGVPGQRFRNRLENHEIRFRAVANKI